MVWHKFLFPKDAVLTFHEDVQAHLCKDLEGDYDHEDALFLLSQQRLHVGPARAHQHDDCEEQDAPHECEDVICDVPAVRVTCTPTMPALSVTAGLVVHGDNTRRLLGQELFQDRAQHMAWGISLAERLSGCRAWAALQVGRHFVIPVFWVMILAASATAGKMVFMQGNQNCCNLPGEADAHIFNKLGFNRLC